MEEEMEEVLGGRMHRVGHVQIAQAPERNEPDPRSGEWPDVIARLQRLGYNGAIGPSINRRCPQRPGGPRPRSDRLYPVNQLTRYFYDSENKTRRQSVQLSE